MSAACFLTEARLRAPCSPLHPPPSSCAQEAFSQLARFQQARLEARLSLADWQTVLDAGLAGPPPPGAEADGGKAAAAKAAAAIRDTAQALLLRYLGLAAEGGGGADGEEGEEEEVNGELVLASDGEDEWLPAVAAAGGRQQPDSLAVWVARLEALRALPPHAEACATATHLRAAWRDTLAAALQPEQLAVLGEVEPAGDAGGATAAGEGEGSASGGEDDMWG